MGEVLPQLLADHHVADVTLDLAVRAALLIPVLCVFLSCVPVCVPLAAGTRLLAVRVAVSGAVRVAVSGAVSLAVRRAVGGLQGLPVGPLVPLVPGHGLLVVLPVAAVHRAGEPGHHTAYVLLVVRKIDGYCIVFSVFS